VGQVSGEINPLAFCPFGKEIVRIVGLGIVGVGIVGVGCDSTVVVIAIGVGEVD